MYTQLTPDRMGLADSRITASSTPPTMPITIPIAVSSSVLTTPSRIWLLNTYCPTTPQPNRVCLTSPRCTRAKINVLTSIAMTTAMTATATHRPG